MGQPRRHLGQAGRSQGLLLHLRLRPVYSILSEGELPIIFQECFWQQLAGDYARMMSFKIFESLCFFSRQVTSFIRLLFNGGRLKSDGGTVSRHAMQSMQILYILSYAYEYRTVILLTTAQNRNFNYTEARFFFLQSFIILLSMRPMWIDGNNQISIHTPNLQLCPLTILFSQTNLQI